MGEIPRQQGKERGENAHTKIALSHLHWMEIGADEGGGMCYGKGGVPCPRVNRGRREGERTNKRTYDRARWPVLQKTEAVPVHASAGTGEWKINIQVFPRDNLEA